MTDNEKQPEHQHATLSGRWLVVLTLSLFLLVPTVTYFAYQATQGTPARADLDYDQRDQWFMQTVKSRPLKYSKFVAAETGKTYKKTDLTIDPDIEAVLIKCSIFAQSTGFLQREDLRDMLIPHAKEAANGFYPPYLLASWYLANGNQAEHDRWMKIAFDRADTAIVQKLVDEDGEPVAGYALPPVAIGYDRVTDGKIDTTLVLIYPRPTSQVNGYVYLPVYRSVYRFTDPALPVGVDPGLHPTKLTLLPQESNGPEPNWFAVPDGAVGQLGDASLTTDEIEKNKILGYMQDYKREIEQSNKREAAPADQSN